MGQGSKCSPTSFNRAFVQPSCFKDGSQCQDDTGCLHGICSAPWAARSRRVWLSWNTSSMGQASNWSDAIYCSTVGKTNDWSYAVHRSTVGEACKYSNATYSSTLGESGSWNNATYRSTLGQGQGWITVEGSIGRWSQHTNDSYSSLFALARAHQRQ